MKHTILRQLIILCGLLAFSSCVVVHPGEGPDGRDGDAYISIDYSYVPPFSYWDNNPNLPGGFVWGADYLTLPGIYDFEYFINETEYWYGTYEVYILFGQPGQPYGVAGADAPDVFTTLFCDPFGPEEIHQEGLSQFGRSADPADVSGELTQIKGNTGIVIKYNKGILENGQQPKTPKFKSLPVQ